MFKIIKKWYFKFYHLLRFLGIFILIFGLKNNVYAIDTVTKSDLTFETYDYCSDSINIIPNILFNGKRYQSSSPTSMVSSFNYSSTFLYKVKSQTSYTLETTTYPYYKYVYFFAEDLSFISSLGLSYATQIKPYRFNTITTPENTSYLAFSFGGYSANFAYSSEDYLFLYEGSTLQSYVPFSPTSCISPNPPVPDNNVYSNFLNLYTDRITYLAEGFTNNPYLLAMVGIIFGWIVLELFLHIFHLRGGYKK